MYHHKKLGSLSFLPLLPYFVIPALSHGVIHDILFWIAHKVREVIKDKNSQYPVPRFHEKFLPFISDHLSTYSLNIILDNN